MWNMLFCCGSFDKSLPCIWYILGNILYIYCRFAGKIVGRYYDSEGNPTKYLKGVEMKAKRGAQLLEKQKREEDKIPSCNSKWSEAEGGEVSNPFNWFLSLLLSVYSVFLKWLVGNLVPTEIHGIHIIGSMLTAKCRQFCIQTYCTLVGQ